MDMDAINKVITEALSDGRAILVEPEAKRILKASSIDVPASGRVGDVGEAVETAKRIGFPVVLKVISPDMAHKSDFGGVVLGIRDEAQLQDEWAHLILHVADENPTARIEGFLVEKMVPRGVEVIAGAIRDEQFGPVVLFGTGGIAVELMKDVSYRLAPLTREEAFEMMGEVKGFPLLSGFRGEEEKDLEAVAKVLMTLGEIVGSAEGIKEIEINPLIVHEHGATAVDARAVLK